MKKFDHQHAILNLLTANTAVFVKLDDNTILSRSDLPPINTKRWVASLKAAVIRVFMAGLMSKSDLLELYALSNEEFDEWLKQYINAGTQGLKITKRS